MAYSVLFVDSDDLIHSIVREILVRDGAITTTAVTSTEAALDLLASGSFDAVIACHRIPEIDGQEFIRTVRCRFSDLPAVLLSPDWDNRTAAEALRYGAAAVLFIPFSVKEFLEVVHTLKAAVDRRKGITGGMREPILDQAVLDNIPAMVAVFGRSWLLLQWNSAVETVTGWSPKELYGMEFTAWLPEIRTAGSFSWLSRDWEREGHGSFESLLQVRSGKPIPYLFTIRRQEIGGMAYFVVAGTDIGVRRRMQEMSEQAHRTLRERTGYVRRAAKSQAGAISRYLEPARDNPGSADPGTADAVLAATDAVLEGLWLTENTCRDFCPGQSGWQDTAAILARLTMPAGIALVAVPPLPEVFAGDAFEKVFSTLLGVAAREGRNVSQVRVSAEETGSVCVIRFEDNGAYLPVVDRALLFEPPSLSGASKRTDGLALYYAREILAVAGIVLHPPFFREEGGERFTIEVPKLRYRFGTTTPASGVAPQPTGVPAPVPGKPNTPSAPAPAAPQTMVTPAVVSGKPGMPSAPAPVAPQTMVAPAPVPGKPGVPSAPAPATRPAAAVLPPAPHKPGRVNAAPPAPAVPAADTHTPELPEWEERFRVLAENLPNAVLLMDRDLRFRYANPAVLLKLGGKPYWKAPGNTPAETGLPEHVVRLWTDAARDVFSSAKPREIEFRLREDSGLICWTLAPVQGPDGSVTQVLAVDRWKPDLADEASAREFLSITSLQNAMNRHEIPLQATVMMSSLEMIRIIAMPDKETSRQVQYHYDRIRHGLEEIVNRIQASRFWLDIVPRELRWQDVAAVIALQEVPAGITIEAVRPLPVIFADIKLPLVFSCIFRYTAGFSGGRTIRISATETTDGCTILVEDNGSGIPDEEKKKIFNHSYSDHRDFDIAETQWILSLSHIGIGETGIPGKGIRFVLTVPEGWYWFGPPPASPWDPPTTGSGKKE